MATIRRSSTVPGDVYDAIRSADAVLVAAKSRAFRTGDTTGPLRAPTTHKTIPKNQTSNQSKPRHAGAKPASTPFIKGAQPVINQPLTRAPNSPKARNIPPLDMTTRFSAPAF